MMADAAPAHLLTLNDALALARENRPDLRQQQAILQQDVALANVGRAALLPQLNGSVQYSRSTNNFAATPGSVPRSINGEGPVQSESVNYWNGALTLTQLIYDFGTTYQAYYAQLATAESQRASVRDTLSKAMMDVRGKFFAARQKQAIVAVQRDNLDNQDKHRAQVEAYVRVGKRPQIDLLQARTDHSNARVALLSAQGDFGSSLAALIQAMGVNNEMIYDVADERFLPLAGEDAPLSVLLEEGLANRADYQALDLQYESQRRTIAASRGAWWPSISASAGLTDAGQELDNLAWNWNLGVRLNWSLFGSGETYYNVIAGEHLLASIAALRDAARLQVRLDIEQGRISVATARDQLDASEDARINAAELLKQAEGRYAAGIGGIIELADAQLKFTQAAGQKVQNEYALANARVTLNRALGRI